MTTQQEELLAEAKRHVRDLTAKVALALRDDDELEDLTQEPLSIETLTTVRVTLGTGGPAYGVDFHGVDGSDFLTASAWHQDWFTERVHWDLDDDVAQYLWSCWGDW